MSQASENRKQKHARMASLRKLSIQGVTWDAANIIDIHVILQSK